MGQTQLGRDGRIASEVLHEPIDRFMTVDNKDLRAIATHFRVGGVLPRVWAFTRTLDFDENSAVRA